MLYLRYHMELLFILIVVPVEEEQAE